MRSAAAPFDLRAALSAEVRGALEAAGSPSFRQNAIHRCRVHLKRARALAKLSVPSAPGLAKVFNDQARRTMKLMEKARDLTALAATARRVGRRANKAERRALFEIAATLDLERAESAPVDIDAIHTALRDLLALAQVWPETSARQLDKGAERLARRARRACKNGRRAEEIGLRHDWRKREKDRLYAVSLLGEHWPAKRQRRVKTSERLGDALGRERDKLLLLERIETAQPPIGEHKGLERAHRALSGARKRLAKRADRIGAYLHRGRA